MATLLGWVALALGLVATWLIPHTRHGWLIGATCALAWAVVDVAISLWSGLVAAVIGAALNLRCWRRNVRGAA